MLDFKQYRIGESSQELILNSKADNYAACLRLIEQAKYSIHIYAYDLDPALLNSLEITERIKDLAIKDRRSHVKILLHDSRKIVLQGHQLIALARHLSSYIEIRKTPVELKDHTENFIIVDKTGLIYRKNYDRFEGSVHFNDRHRCSHLLEFFNTAWEKSSPDPELRRLNL